MTKKNQKSETVMPTLGPTTGAHRWESFLHLDMIFLDLFYVLRKLRCNPFNEVIVSKTIDPY